MLVLAHPKTGGNLSALGDQPGVVIEEKADGFRCLVETDSTGDVSFSSRSGHPLQAFGDWSSLPDCAFDGELLPNGSLVLFDVLRWFGDDATGKPLRERRALLERVAWPEGIRLAKRYSDAKEAKREAGEGVVVKDPDAAYGCGWVKWKRCQTWDVEVIALPRPGVASVALDGEDVGCVVGMPASVQIGDCVGISCHSRHASGKFREARLVRVRADKSLRPVASYR